LLRKNYNIHTLLYVNYHLSHIGMLIYVHVTLEMPHPLL
jgi:hypothetical protein